MKKLSAIVLLCALLVLLAACGQGEPGSRPAAAGPAPAPAAGPAPAPAAGPASPLVGKWKIVQASGPGADMNMGTVYEFSADGKLRVAKMSLSNEFTYTVDGDVVNWQKDENFKFNAKFKIDGNRMDFEFGTSSQKFVMEKQ